MPIHPSARRTSTTRTKKLKRVLEIGERSHEKVATDRGKYNSYTPEERAQIGKYAVENGNSKAAKHFSEDARWRPALKHYVIGTHLQIAKFKFRQYLLRSVSPNLMLAKVSRYTV